MVSMDLQYNIRFGKPPMLISGAAEAEVKSTTVTVSRSIIHKYIYAL